MSTSTDDIHPTETLNTTTDAGAGTVQVSRRHDLDALRAIAMLLGIVLHAALSFSPIPWTVQDTQQSEFYTILFSAIHGFRMPLFFMLSGFFTAMLWRKRGLGGLVRQRLKRIALPLFIGCLTIVPMMWGVSYFVNRPSSSAGAQNETVWQSVVAGDTDQVRSAIEVSEIDINAVSSDGASLLTVAVFLGHTDMVEMLLDEGADVNQRNRDQGTALHSAAFVGRAKEARILVRAGADANLADMNGQTPKDLLKTDFGTTSFIAGSFGLSLEEETLKKGRADIANELGTQEYLGSPSASSNDSGLEAIKGLLFQLPVFMHLWFLWFLCWLIAVFLIYAPLANVLKLKRLPNWLVCSPVSLLWLVPLTMVPQMFMSPGSFGPDPSIGLLPIPSVLIYYAIFFFFGALYWEMDDAIGGLGRGWGVTLAIALLIVFPVGLDLVSETFGIVPWNDETLRPVAANLLQALFAWLMTFGSIGLCRSLMSHENKAMRYISDSSYWLYLAHLPLVLLAQWFVRESSVPAFAKFAGVTVVVSAFLLLTYEYGVRYTWIGRMLNGPRSRPTHRRIPTSA